ANIAVGQSSIIADRVGLKLFDYHVTESGFGADIGFEKFWNVKSRFSGLKPNVSVLTTTIRALKSHGGGPKVTPGIAMPEEYTQENVGMVEKGCVNMVHHINTIRKAGINPVVCINRFYTDTDEECVAVRKAAEAAGARCAESKHWEKGGEGALEFADAVVDACNEENDFKFLYPLEMKLRDRVETIAKEVYATLKGAPKGWTLPIRDILIYSGAKFLCPCAGTISLMPGTGSNPAFRRIDVDTENGQVSGLF
ncbi:MAG: formate--tetrahydrofolate ligase, partial [Deltaproteobacteria bacterium]|nr:formate--tetrahydrofolate ligase [Deltaproteobacteria bacterium]